MSKVFNRHMTNSNVNQKRRVPSNENKLNAESSLGRGKSIRTSKRIFIVLIFCEEIVTVSLFD